ncbi:MAG: MaoC family dehydratase [Planctomycetes bacterium]|jgi:3-hydroxybutyryl-CoA dehydratase|nr:MaoC family dehydratase [Planctomycetota bacterium]MCC7066277.1 MaoC family dehydratase [Planctomycetota bacterium]
MPYATTAERMHRCDRLDADEVARFASLCGDQNPIHHDAEFASRTRFGGIVVSGPQLSSLLMGMTATHFSRPGPNGPRAMLGLDFRFRFRRAVRAGQPIELAWEVVAVREKASLGGDLVFLAGRVRDERGEDAVKAVGKVLVREAL